MEWAQVLAIVIPVMLTIVIGVIYNNRRIDDLRLDMDRRFAEVHDELKEIKTDIRELKADTDKRFDELKSDTDKRFDELKSDIREIRQFLLRLIPIPEPPKDNPR